MNIHKVNEISEDAEIGMRWIHYIWGNTSGWVEIADWEMKNPDFLIDAIKEVLKAYNYPKDSLDFFNDPIKTNIDENRAFATAKCEWDDGGNDMEFMWWE